jgi:hypothetical protein
MRKSSFEVSSTGTAAVAAVSLGAPSAGAASKHPNSNTNPSIITHPVI